MADFPMTVSLLVKTYSLWFVFPLRTTSVGTFMRVPANCMDSPIAAACWSILRRSLVSSTMVSSMRGAAALRPESQGTGASPLASTLILCLPMWMLSPSCNVARSTRRSFTKVPLRLSRSSTTMRPASTALLKINLGVVIGHGEVVHRQVVVRGAADGHRPRANRNLFDDFVFKHEAKLRHLNFLQD